MTDCQCVIENAVNKLLSLQTRVLEADMINGLIMLILPGSESLEWHIPNVNWGVSFLSANQFIKLDTKRTERYTSSNYYLGLQIGNDFSISLIQKDKLISNDRHWKKKRTNYIPLYPKFQVHNEKVTLIVFMYGLKYKVSIKWIWIFTSSECNL